MVTSQLNNGIYFLQIFVLYVYTVLYDKSFDKHGNILIMKSKYVSSRSVHIEHSVYFYLIVFYKSPVKCFCRDFIICSSLRTRGTLKGSIVEYFNISSGDRITNTSDDPRSMVSLSPAVILSFGNNRSTMHICHRISDLMNTFSSFRINFVLSECTYIV